MRLFFNGYFCFHWFFVYWAIFCSEACSHLLEFSPKAENVLLTENDTRKKYIHESRCLPDFPR